MVANHVCWATENTPDRAVVPPQTDVAEKKAKLADIARRSRQKAKEQKAQMAQENEQLRANVAQLQKLLGAGCDRACELMRQNEDLQRHLGLLAQERDELRATNRDLDLSRNHAKFSQAIAEQNERLTFSDCERLRAQLYQKHVEVAQVRATLQQYTAAAAAAAAAAATHLQPPPQVAGALHEASTQQVLMPTALEPSMEGLTPVAYAQPSSAMPAALAPPSAAGPSTAGPSVPDASTAAAHMPIPATIAPSMLHAHWDYADLSGAQANPMGSTQLPPSQQPPPPFNTGDTQGSFMGGGPGQQQSRLLDLGHPQPFQPLGGDVFMVDGAAQQQWQSSCLDPTQNQ